MLSIHATGKTLPRRLHASGGGGPLPLQPNPKRLEPLQPTPQPAGVNATIKPRCLNGKDNNSMMSVANHLDYFADGKILYAGIWAGHAYSLPIPA